VLSVDYPASDPAITAAGGTTLRGLQEYCLNALCTRPFFDVNIKHERVWGWDYLVGFCDAIGFDPVSCGIFPAGSGGGVSILFPKPRYQFDLPGVQRTQPDQIFEVGGDFTGDGVFEFDLPGHYRGRNVPDVSFNADPNTGYIVSYTSDQTGFGIGTFFGGTSFVAPQLNGVSALLGEYLGARIGLLNFPLYGLARSGKAYRGSHPPLNAIPHGNNWFYHGRNGYSPAVGLGTLDVENFARALRRDF
jgi:subtilase family serine protease